MKISIRRNTWLAAAALGVCSLPAVAQLSFHPPIAYPAGTDPEAVATADFDGDGDVDIAVTLHSPARLGLLRNQGDGTFGAPEFTNMTAGVDPAGIAAADFDGDGDIDLVVSQRGNDTLKFGLNDGAGHFTPGDFVVVGDAPNSLVVFDFDGDGDLDVAVANRGSSGVSFVRNNGGGDFSLLQGLGVGGTPKGLATGRFGVPAPGVVGSTVDVVVASHDARRLDVLHNQGDGHFNLQLSLPLNERPEDVAVADFDGDGNDDIAATVGETSSNALALVRQTAPGVFAAPQYFDAGGAHPVGIVARDFDLDLRVDLALVESDSSLLSILRNTGAPQFAAPITFALLGPAPDFVAFGDFDGNHYADLVVTNDVGNSVSVLLNGWDNPSTYCATAPNSVGSGALMGWTGSVKRSANDVTLQVQGAPANVNGYFFFGHSPQQVPYFNGTLCVGAPVVRIGPVMQTSSSGLAARQLDFMTWPAEMISDGSVWNFQFWYRDPAGGGAHTNFSNALRVFFEL
jgi:hypothetical protein